VQLAACYRIFDMLGWTEMIFNHITLRVPGPAVAGFPSARFLINPFGLHYREVTASSLVLIDLEGNVLRESKWPVNRAGFVIHSAIHGAVPQAHCVMHTHTTNGVAVSCLKNGLSSDNFYGAMLHGRVAYHDLQGVTVLGVNPPVLSRSSWLVKRALDLAAAAFLALITLPLMAVLAVAIKLDSRGPVFFRQERILDSRRTFRIWKLRTMVADAEERKPGLAHLNVHTQHGGDGKMFKIENDPRITRVGRLLRKHSLDELPQLINVLVGEMSLVGPRPLIPEEHRYVTEWRRRRLELKPGVTGLWQVNGRSNVAFEEMVELDYRYVTNWSPWLDLTLLLRTFSVVLRGPAEAV